MLQKSIEQQFSKDNIKKKVLNEINVNSKVIKLMVNKIDRYREKTYYESKTDRINKLKTSSLQLAVEITAAVIVETRIVPIQSIIAKLLGSLGYESVVDGVKTAGELLAVCDNTVYELVLDEMPDETGNTLSIESKFTVSNQLQKFIQETMYLPPLISKPNKWTCNTGGGWFTLDRSVLLKKINHHNEELALDVINILQDIPWELNTSMLEFEELPSKPLDTQEKKVNFKKLVKDSEKVYDYLLSNNNTFYFVWRYDARGRMYSQGYHVNIQSNAYRKAMLDFKDKTLITEDIIV